MSRHSGTTDERTVRAAEPIAAACLATDLGMGFPFEHGLHATLMTARLAEVCGVDRETTAHAYYASLLMYAGCTIDTDVTLRIFGGDMTATVTPAQFGSSIEAIAGVIRALPDPDGPGPRRAVQVARRLPRAARRRAPHFAGLCEVATMLSDRLGVPPAVPAMFTYLTERWDGQGALRRARGDAIPLPLRLVHVARDAAFQRVVGDDDHAVATVRRRGGHAFDPAITEAFAAHAPDVFAAADVDGSAWDATLAAEPRPWLALEGAAAIDRSLAVLGDFADLISPFQTGHSRGVAELAAAAGAACGFVADDVALLRRAGWIHDVGRVAVHPRIWQKPGPLNADEWEHVRLHAYHGERLASRSGLLAPLAAVGGAHHERLGGDGYHRGLSGATLSAPARVLAAADVFHALTEPRPHRDARPPAEAAAILEAEARQGRLDPTAVSAVLETSGRRPEALGRPAGLTERESEVMALLARGLLTKQVARHLGISPKTADRHIQNAYRKAGVSTRAGATVFAMEHGLLPWGGLPMSSEPRPI